MQMQEMWEKAEKKGKGTSGKDAKFIHNSLMNKIHNRFSVLYLQDLFTVDVDDKESSIKIKGMPNSYQSAITAIDTIYKVFA